MSPIPKCALVSRGTSIRFPAFGEKNEALSIDRGYRFCGTAKQAERAAPRWISFREGLGKLQIIGYRPLFVDQTGAPAPLKGASRRGGRVVECTALEMRRTREGTQGSNPCLSATQSQHQSPSSGRRVNAAALAGLQGPTRFQPGDMRCLRPAFGPTPRRSLRADRNRFGFPVLKR